MIEQVDPETFMLILNNREKVDHAFFGHEAHIEGSACYIVDGEMGFAISKKRELIRVFNGSYSSKLLTNPEVQNIIKRDADWLVTIGYRTSGSQNIDLSDYYHETIGFNTFGYTEADVEDMLSDRGIDDTLYFIRKYGIPYQVFMINNKFAAPLNPGYYDYNGYFKAKKNLFNWLPIAKEE